jgi:hypothetical protein
VGTLLRSFAHPTASDSSSLAESIRHITHVSAPVTREVSTFDVAMEAAMGPFHDGRDQAMLHRIEMDVVDVMREIVIVADGVFPKASLPNSLFAFGDLAVGA